MTWIPPACFGSGPPITTVAVQPVNSNILSVALSIVRIAAAMSLRDQTVRIGILLEKRRHTHSTLQPNFAALSPRVTRNQHRPKELSSTPYHRPSGDYRRRSLWFRQKPPSASVRETGYGVRSALPNRFGEQSPDQSRAEVRS
jgi:hypothetical protein